MTNKEIDEIRERLEAIYDDYRNGTLKELDAIKHIGINDEKDSVVLIVETSQKESKAEDELKRKIAKVIKLDLGYSGVKIQFEEAKTIANIAFSSTKVIFIAGLGGGCGKSVLALNLAYALKSASKKVAIIDADIYGASIVKMLKASDSGLNVNSVNKIVPPRHDGIELMSIDFFSSDDNDALLWRAEMLSSMINEDADMALCKYSNQNTAGKMDCSSSEKLQPLLNAGIYDRASALNALITGKINTAVWNKLYKRSLWSSFRFYEGHVYEDVEIAYKTFSRINNHRDIADLDHDRIRFPPHVR